MKRLFSVLMVAAIATFTFAFTPPKSAFNSTLHFEEGEWVPGNGFGCTGDLDACEITTSTNGVDGSAVPTILSQYSGTIPYTTSAIDHDGSPSTPDQTVTVTQIKRFAVNP